MTAVLALTAVLVATLVAGSAGATAGDPSFAANPVALGGRVPCAAATADFNRDAHTDLAVADCHVKSVVALFGDGAGGFRAAAGAPLPVGEDVQSVIAADVNRDAAPDLAVLSRGELRLLLGDGTGRFAPAPGSPVKLVDAAAMVATDLTGDGRIDIAVASRQSKRTRIAALLGDGTGRFAWAPRTPVPLGDIYASSLAAADFNGDTKLDLALGADGEAPVRIVLGDGAGGFRAGTTVRGSLLAVADFNADGKPDLAIGTVDRDDETRRAGTALGTGTGRFRPAVSSRIVVGPSTTVGTALDLNGDRRLDLAVANYQRGLSTLLGDGRGRFRTAAESPFPWSAPSFFSPPFPRAVLAADLNGDDRPDLTVPTASPHTNGLIVMWQTQPAPAASAGGTLPGRRDAVFSTRGSISELAVDGNRVAVMTASRKGTCGRVVVWTAPGRTAKTFKTDEGCVEASTIPYHVVELALGGGQVVWIGEVGGNSLELLMHVAKLSGGRAKQIEYANNSNGATGDPAGDWVGQLQGGGPLLVYNRWSAVCTVPPDHGCGWSEPTLRLVKQRLFRIVAGRRSMVKRGSGSYPVSAVGGGRMAVQSAGVVTVLGPRGGRVATVPALQGNPPRGIALSRTRLAVERTLELDVHDPATGTKAKSIPLGPAAALRLIGVNSRLALLRGPRRLALVRLSDGKLISLAFAPRTADSVVDARLSEAGLFYAYNRPRGATRGRIVFEPVAKLLRRF